MAHNHNSVQYYWRNSKTDAKGRYLRRSEEEMARLLAQKDYAVKFVRFLTKKKLELQKCPVDYQWEEITKFHETFSEERQELIRPYVLSNDDYAARWEAKGRSQMCDIERYPLDEDTGFKTERGELVRSKSEKILADKLYMKNIPYVYEKPLYLKGGARIYPDFTVLNRYTREEFYWEHFGMMDKTEYCEKAIEKIRKYHKNRIYHGSKLIVTYETSAQPLRIQELEELIDEFLLTK